VCGRLSWKTGLWTKTLNDIGTTARSEGMMEMIVEWKDDTYFTVPPTIHVLPQAPYRQEAIADAFSVQSSTLLLPFSFQISVICYIYCTVRSIFCLQWVQYDRHTNTYKGKGKFGFGGIHVKTTPIFPDPFPALVSSRDLAAHSSTQQQHDLQRVSIRRSSAAWRHRRRLHRAHAEC
jgi:hypothetical protein